MHIYIPYVRMCSQGIIIIILGPHRQFFFFLLNTTGSNFAEINVLFYFFTDSQHLIRISNFNKYENLYTVPIRIPKCSSIAQSKWMKNENLCWLVYFGTGTFFTPRTHKICFPKNWNGIWLTYVRTILFSYKSYSTR